MRSTSSQFSRLSIGGFTLFCWCGATALALAQEPEPKKQPTGQSGVISSTIQIGTTTPEVVTLDAGSATVSKARRTISVSLESLDQRILLEPRETVVLKIANSLPTDESIKLSAPNGGNINGGKGHAKLNSPADLQNVQFSVGKPPGLYVLEVKHGQGTHTIEFWVGPVPPIGQPGPARKFSGN